MAHARSPRNPGTADRPLPFLATQAAFLGLGCSVLYTVANTLFLERYGSELLPYVYLVTAAAVSAVFALLMRLQRRLPLGAFAFSTLAVFSALLLAARVGLGIARLDGIAFALMPAVVMAMQISMIVLGAQSSQIWNVQELKRRYPLVMAGQIAGVIVGGALVGPLGRLLGGAANLLYLAALSMAAAAALVTTTARARTEGAVRPPSRTGRASGARHLVGPYVVMLLGFRMLVELGSNLVNYLFLRRVEISFRGTDRLTGFLGAFMAVATLLTLVFLVAAAGRMLMRWGVTFALAANPVAVGLTLVGAAAIALLGGEATPAFLVLVLAARLVNFVVVTGLTDPALKTAYQPLAPERRAAVQTVVEGVGVPMAVGLAGVVLLAVRAVRGVRPPHIVLLTVLLMVGVVLMAVAAGRAYRAALQRTLDGARLPPGRITLEDAASLRAARALLDSARTDHVLLGLDLLEHAGRLPPAASLAALLGREDTRLRVEVLERIERLRLTEILAAVRPLACRASEPRLRAAAARVICALDRSAAESSRAFLADPDTEVRIAAMAGLLRSRGVDGALEVAPAIRRLADSGTCADRLMLARLVGETSRPDFLSPLRALLADPDVPVRRAALQAAARTRAAALAPEIVRAVEDPATRTEAMGALVSLGEALLPFARTAVEAAGSLRPDTALRVIRATSRLPATTVGDLYAHRLDHPDSDTRLEMMRALTVSGWKSGPEDRPRLRVVLRGELGHGAALDRAAAVLSDNPRHAGVLRALRDERTAAARRVALLCGLMSTGGEVCAAYDRMRAEDAKERALARELLEVSLDRELRGPVLGFLDPGAGSRPSGAAALSPQPLLAEIARDADRWPYPWLRACAVHALGRAEGGYPMPYHAVDVEKVALLRSSTIFSETPDRALAALATLVERVEASEGQTVIHKGDMESCLYVVATGEVRVHDGERLIATLGEGEIIGEMALLDPAPRSASVTTVSDTVLFRLDKEAFDVALADNPEIVHGVLRVLCRRLRTQIQKPAGPS